MSLLLGNYLLVLFGKSFASQSVTIQPSFEDLLLQLLLNSQIESLCASDLLSQLPLQVLPNRLQLLHKQRTETTSEEAFPRI